MTEPDVSSQAYPPDFHREMRNTAEVQYAGRYFTILVDENGTSHASGGSFGLDDEEASALASDILGADTLLVSTITISMKSVKLGMKVRSRFVCLTARLSSRP